MNNIKDRGPECTGFRSFKWLQACIIALLLLIAAVIYYGSQLVLVIQPEEGKKAFVFPTAKGDTWHISLTHSVEKTLWEEFFRVEGHNSQTLTHTTFESLGWGFPYGEYEGKLIHRSDNRYELEMNRRFTSVPLRISVQAMQHFHHGATDLDLCKIYGQGTKMDIKIIYRYETW